MRGRIENSGHGHARHAVTWGRFANELVVLFGIGTTVHVVFTNGLYPRFGFSGGPVPARTLGRFSALLGATWIAWSTAIVIQAIVFGLGHAYLGVSGALSAGVSAFAYGLFYMLAGRNLWPLILVHGIWDTLGISLVYLSGHPTT